MTKYTVKVDGMACGMCEAHVNDAVRAACNVKKVSSSHTKGETVILTEQDIPDDTLKGLIEKTGYQLELEPVVIGDPDKLAEQPGS